MSFSKIKTLLLYTQYTNTLSYYDDWREAFENASQFYTDAININDTNNIKTLERSIHGYDFIVILHSAMDVMDPIKPYENILISRKCKLVSFVANEVNLPWPSSLKLKIEFLNNIGSEYIATQLPLEAGKWLYEECKKSKVVAIPHALNPNSFKPVIPEKDRTIDIGVRSYKYMPYLGDNERNELFEFFQNYKFNPPISIDINLKDRFNRADWSLFLNTSKATLANEVGSYYLEKDDKTVNAIIEYFKPKFEKSNPNLKVMNKKHLSSKIRHVVPGNVKKIYKKIFGYVHPAEMHSYMDYDEIYEKFFKNYPKPSVYSKAISSRHFDAIGTKTLQIMFPGRYNGILKENVHYIALKKDFSNIEEVMRKFYDIDFRTAMVNESYHYIMENHTYRNRMEQMEEIARA